MGISHNTRLNWKRLQPERNQKLQRGANKSRSVRKILPTEYISCRESLLLAAQVLDISKKNKLSRAEILFSLAVKLLKDRGLFDKEHVQALLSDFLFPPMPFNNVAQPILSPRHMAYNIIQISTNELATP